MIKTYESGQSGRTRVFFKVSKDSKISAVIIGNQFVPSEQGFQFYVDDYVASQIEKCELYLEGLTPKLQLKDGEELNIPSEEEKKQREINELERKLRELRGEEESEYVDEYTQAE